MRMMLWLRAYQTDSGQIFSSALDSNGSGFKIRRNGFIPSLVYGIATLTAQSRVHDIAHWASNVFIGSAVGYFCSQGNRLVYIAARKDSYLTVLPIRYSASGALLILYRF